MGRKSGSADLPLHGGGVPQWLAGRMTRLSRVITEAIVGHYGRDEFLRRMAHPFWFQSFGAVTGMDWHSSGITTSLLGALKRGLAPLESELGIFVCGGRGKHSRKTPLELSRVGELTGIDGDALARTSRLVAKVDSAAVQDGFDIYVHSFIVTRDGAWTVVQQGMNTERKQARRYHWLSQGLRSFVDAPHTAIDGDNQGTIINLTDRRAEHARRTQVGLVHRGPDAVLDEMRREVLPHLSMPAHHDVRASDIVLRRLRGNLAAAAERGPRDFEELLLTPGVGKRTVEALALVSEVVHGAPSRFTDPARFSWAHGGKDGHPFPVPTKVYDQTIRVMREAIDRANLGNDDKLAAIRRLDLEARRLERCAGGESFDELIAGERAHSAQYGGRTVFSTRAAKPPQPAVQLTLDFEGASNRAYPPRDHGVRQRRGHQGR